MMKRLLLILVVCGFLAGTAQADNLWREFFDNLDNWTTSGNVSIDNGRIYVDGTQSSLSAWSDWAQNSTYDLSYPAAGETRYLYLWGVQPNTGTGQDNCVSAGISIDSSNIAYPGGFGFNWYGTDKNLYARYNNVWTTGSPLGGMTAAVRDLRVVLTGGSLTATWQEKLASDTTWTNVGAQVAASETDFPDRVLTLSNRGKKGAYWVDGMEYTTEDLSVPSIPEPSTLALLGVGGLVLLLLHRRLNA